MSQRGKFATGLGVIAATLGSAVGLGNIWKFPYVTGENGGAAFIIIYLGCVFFAGLPVMISEFVIGRKSNSNAVGSFKKLSPGSPWYLIGYAGIASAYLIMFFYTGVAGWVYSYFFRALRGDFAYATPALTDDIFTQTISTNLPPVIWQLIVLAVVGTIIIAGVEKGIERMTKALMPVLFVLLIICCARALTLPNAIEGVRFLIKPDFSKVTSATILTAMGLAFFKLSVGMGTMLTYGSYFGAQQDLPATAIKVALSDTVVSLLAGLAIFPTVFAFGFEPNSGPGLLFITIPMVFSKMPFGRILLAAFFLLTSIAATTALLSLMEVPVSFLVDEKGMPRWKATIIAMTSVFIVGLTATLSAHPDALLGKVSILGKTFFDLYDYVSQNLLMPLGGLFIVIYIGWFFGRDNLMVELTNRGNLDNHGLIRIFTIVVRYISPAVITLIFLNALGIIKA